MRNVEDVLEWADHLIFAQTGEHLTPIQEAILTGVWDRKKYPQIAKDYNCSESHIKKEAAKLWEKLGEDLGEDLNKFNFRSKVEKKYRVSQVSNSGDCLLQEIDINICNQFIKNIKNTQSRSQSPPETSQTQNQSTIINLIDAPELTPFYNRTSELTTLKQWILEDHTRLITIYGLSGIGKSALTVKLIEEINSEFDYIIWKSLNNLPTLSTLQTELKDFFSKSQQTPLSTVIDYFRNSRCLVIIDDVQNIFKPDELAGQYLPEYEDYGKFFKQIATSFHQSCLILLSWTKPREIVTLEAENRPVRTLNLKGLGEEAIEILREKRLTDEENWSELITLYQGHPSWLNIIAATINELFNGSIAEFLADQNDIYLGDLHPFLKEYLERLAESEKQVIYWLSTQDEPVNIAQKTANLELSKPEFIQAIQSLIRRNLIEKVEEGGRSLFLLNPMFKHYVRWKLSSTPQPQL
ncbi:NB-ARC domain-containing protein [Planktothrix sp.]|uniref:NB-ARC domain-containing protein n=1 Tax=Planktothrix sp. TaxID=3088171 RepID=UPI0038D3B4D0